jgi:hypothetical protein
MSTRGPKLQELGDAVRDRMADSEPQVAKIKICYKGFCIEFDIDEEDIEEILKPIPIDKILKGQT